MLKSKQFLPLNSTSLVTPAQLSIVPFCVELKMLMQLKKNIYHMALNVIYAQTSNVVTCISSQVWRNDKCVCIAGKALMML